MSKNASCDDQRIKDLCGQKARDGDGTFAIAYVLLALADEQAATARALHWLGSGDAATKMGAIEYLGAQVEKGADTLAHAIEGAADAIGRVG